MVAFFAALGLYIVILTVYGSEAMNGATDAPNSICTVVATRVLSLRQAIIMAVIGNFFGALLLGTRVAETIGKGIVDPAAINLETVFAALVALILWSGFAARRGIPTSESHALVAGLTGAALANGGADLLILSGWIKVGIGIITPIFFSALVAYGLAWLVIKTCATRSPRICKYVFRWLQILTSFGMSISHGTNDGPKFMGILALTWYLGGKSSQVHLEPWMVVSCAIVMGVSTWYGGPKIIYKTGNQMTTLENWQGCVAELAAVIGILAASFFGIPLSTTQAINMAMMGAGRARGEHALNKGVVKELFMAWGLTFAVCGSVAFVAALLSHQFSILFWWVINSIALI